MTPTSRLRLPGALASLLWMIGQSAPLQAAPMGCLQTVTHQSIRGWALNPDDPSTPIRVRVRVLEHGRVVGTRDLFANESQPETTALFSRWPACGFSILNPAAPGTARRLVELSLWSTTEQCFLPHAAWALPALASSASLIDMEDLHVHHDEAAHELVIYLWLLPQRPPPGVELSLDVWGEKGTWSTEVVLPAAPADPPPHVLTRIPLATNPRVRDRFEASRTALVTLSASDRASGEPPAAVCTLELPVRASPPTLSGLPW